MSAGGPARKDGLSRGEPIRAENILGDILSAYPETEKVFRKYYGDGCFSCPGQATESVKQSAMMHNVIEKQILSDLNRAAGF
jgi:iron-sulfur cluster repair protein YtfE (RIC family)